MPTALMGILNCTPDSFYDGGNLNSQALIQKGLQLVEEGASLLDVGGESTRPQAKPVTLEEELNRVIPVIQGLRRHSPSLFLSIDTTKPQVAELALKEGVGLINSVNLQLAQVMAPLAARYGASLVLMHSRGTPQTMGQLTQYDNLVENVLKEIETGIEIALSHGLTREQIWIDPGFGFAKTSDQNLELLKNLPHFKKRGHPLLVGVSRKNFIGAVLNQPEASKRFFGTLAANLYAAMKGADYLRVHDVRASWEMLTLWKAIEEAGTLPRENF